MAHTPDGQRALRARLMELHGAVRAYFEATSADAAGYWGAFDALRRNQPLAQVFVGDLQALLEYIEREVAPALGAKAAPVPAAAPQAPRTPSGLQRSVSINEDETMLLNRLPESVQKEAMRFAAGKAPDDDDDSSLLDADVDMTGETTPPPSSPPPAAAAPAQPAPAKPAAPAKPLPGMGPAAAKKAPGPAAPANTAAPAPDKPARSAASPQRAGSAIAARIAAVNQQPGTPGTPASKSPQPRAAVPAAKPAPERAPAPAPGIRTAPPKAASTPPRAAAAAKVAPGEPRPAPQRAAAKPAGRERAPVPQFDESDLTNPGFTLDIDPTPLKKR